MKHIIYFILAIIIGGFIGFFGVLVSVFADGSLLERLVTIVVILLIYGVSSGLFGLYQQKYSWQWGFFLGSPGVLLLGFYVFNEFNPYYLVYMLLIISISCFCAWGGNRIRKRMKMPR